MPNSITSKVEHDAALASMDRLITLDPKSGSPEGDELERLSRLVRDYESIHFPIGTPSPEVARRFRMEQMGLGQGPQGDGKIIG